MAPLPNGIFELFVFVVAFAAAAVASVAGFGIGSLLTPALGLAMGTKIAVAVVSVPHFIGTAIRLWLMRDAVDRHVLLRFGSASAAGGLTGAVLHGRFNAPVLSLVFGGLLIFVAMSELTGLAKRMRLHGAVAWIAGALSGLLGGLVGNQGGIRSAALLGFDLPKRAFVATATATGLIVDLARMPVYVATSGSEMLSVWPLALVGTAGVIVGTLFGGKLLARVPDRLFRPMVALLLAALGAAMLAQGLRERAN
jgi:uncharacterized membrane protein YfcA